MVIHIVFEDIFDHLIAIRIVVHCSQTGFVYTLMAIGFGQLKDAIGSFVVDFGLVSLLEKSSHKEGGIDTHFACLIGKVFGTPTTVKLMCAA
jgi:hypothetical protein